jgi:ABC-type glutathione transport system ATPase component
LISFEESGIGKQLVMMIVGGIFFLTICLLKDFMVFDWFVYKFLKSLKKPPQMNNNIDIDVKNETERINNMSDEEIAGGNLVLKGLSKYYGGHLAVNQLHLAVGASECFGLLGINGAGKTTTFKMVSERINILGTFN